MCMVVRLLRIYPEQSIVQSVAGVRTLTLQQGQQGATSAQVQQDASSTNQQRVEGTSRENQQRVEGSNRENQQRVKDTSRGNQQRVQGTNREKQQRVEITLESLKMVMRCVAIEVFDEGQSQQQQQQQQPKSLPSCGTTGKRKLRVG